MVFDFSQIAAMGRTYAGGERMVREEARRGIDRSVIQIEADAKRLVPVKTHTLQRSLTHETVDQGGDIVGRAGSNLVYARYVEESEWEPYVGSRGRMTKGRKKQPYLKPALDKNRPDITRKMTAVLKRISARLAAGNG